MHSDEQGHGSLGDSRVDAGPAKTEVLLASDRRWLRSALKDVLEPEGFRVVHVATVDEILIEAKVGRPSVVVVDEELPGLDAEETARDLTSGPLGPGVPLLLYTSSSLSGVRSHARAIEAGFWELLTDPLRPALLVSRLQRLLDIGRQLEPPTAGPDQRIQTAGARASVGYLSLDELERVLPAIVALAERERATVSVVLLAPTSPEAQDPDRDMAVPSSLWGSKLRSADLCAWIDGAEVAVVAYDTTAKEARILVERLEEAAEDWVGMGRSDHPLSAAIVELKPSDLPDRAVRDLKPGATHATSSGDRVGELFRLSDARSALREARDTGGGVRVVDVA